MEKPKSVPHAAQGKEENMPPTLAVGISQDAPQFAPPIVVENTTTEKFGITSSDGRVNVVERHVDSDTPKGEIMNTRLKTIFALAIGAGVLSLLGQQHAFGLSNMQGFVGAVVVLIIAGSIAVSQLRENFPTNIKNSSDTSNL